MLAYVFWHSPFLEADLKAYEAGLVAFHQALATARPEGFRRSAVFRLAGIPWLGTTRPGYEDWYLLDGSFALDRLNEAAVADFCKEVHDRVARWAESGAAGLYRLRSSEPGIAEARLAAWFAKPRGTAYDDFYRQLAPWTAGAGTSLWQRQMVLGPTLEFCLLARRPLALPVEWGPLALARELVWS